MATPRVSKPKVAASHDPTSAPEPLSTDRSVRRAGGGYLIHEPGMANPAVASVFDPSRDEKLKVPYTSQGDPTMYTKEALEARKAIKQSPALRNEISKLQRLADWSDDGKIAKDAWKGMYLAMCECLNPKSTSEERLRLFETEWPRDAGGADATHLTKKQYDSAIFELVDHWTTSLDGAEYIAFTQALGFRLSSLLGRSPATARSPRSSPMREKK